MEWETVTGNYFAEAKMFNAAHQYQTVTDWHRRYPMHDQGRT